MLQVVRKVRDLLHGKYLVNFECGHEVTFDASRHCREGVKPNLIWSCPFCPMDFQVGDMLELRLVFCEAPVVATFIGMVDGRFNFRFEEGETSLSAREIVGYLKLN